MKNRNLTIIELLLVGFISGFILIPHWNSPSTTGDFFCLEIVALLVYNIYENLRK